MSLPPSETPGQPHTGDMEGRPEATHHWAVVLSRLQDRLFAPPDRNRAEEVTSYADLLAALARVRYSPQIDTLDEVLPALHPVLRILSKSFESLTPYLGNTPGCGLFWGFIHVLLQNASREENAMPMIARLLEQFGDSVELFNDLRTASGDLDHIEPIAFSIHTDLATFFVDAIRFLHHHPEENRIYIDTWQSLCHQHEETLWKIDAALDRVETPIRLRELSEELSNLQRLLSLGTRATIAVDNLPCIMLPHGRNLRLFSRGDLIQRIDEHFSFASDQDGFRTLTLHGDGGVGKSHLALEYVRFTRQTFPAVFWVSGETAASLEKCFGDIALQLGLPGAEAWRVEENRVLVLDWLQKTTSRWLIIFDNVESTDTILKYWPVADRGRILITTRNPALVHEPADTAIEVLPFDIESGVRFLAHCLSTDGATDFEFREKASAVELSGQLRGNALAIKTAAAMIRERDWALSEFMAKYNDTLQTLPETAAEDSSLDATLKMAFEYSSRNAKSLLGVLAYLAPDVAPESLFLPVEPRKLPDNLRWCENRNDLHVVLSELLRRGLIRPGMPDGVISTHRLVQTSFKQFLSPPMRQEAFDAATELLFEALPPSEGFGGHIYDEFDERNLYKQHVLRLKNFFKAEISLQEPLKPTIGFCYLLNSLARFMLECADYKPLEDVLEVAAAAYDALPRDEKEMSLLADILTNTGLMWAHRGYWRLSRPFLHRALVERNTMTHSNPLEASQAQVNWSHWLASTGQYKWSSEMQMQAMMSQMTNDVDNLMMVRPQAINNQNLGRLAGLRGNLSDGHIWCNGAMRMFQRLGSMAMVAYTHYVIGNLFRKAKNLEAAKHSYEEAHRIWVHDFKLDTHHFNGACLYKLGCVTAEMGEFDTALNYLDSARTIASLHKGVMFGDYARVLFKISQICSAWPVPNIDGEALRREAAVIFHMHSCAWTRAVMRNMEEEQKYDSLVFIVWR